MAFNQSRQRLFERIDVELADKAQRSGDVI